MSDEYFHEINGVVYVDENIPGPGEQSDEYASLIEKFNSQLVHNCLCDNVCVEDVCNCTKLSGGTNYTCREYKNVKTLIINEDKNFNLYPIIECSELCECSKECGNRLVQNGPIPTLYVKISDAKGLGLFTNSLIIKGSFVCEYAGEVLTKKEVLLRHKHNQAENKMNYIFCLNEHVNGEIFQIFIDPSMFGNIGRYINHSCEPTCRIMPVRVDSPIPKLAVFSCRDISPHTEITFDYGSNNLTNPITDNFGERKKCLCKSSLCKGYMPYDVY